MYTRKTKQTIEEEQIELEKFARKANEDFDKTIWRYSTQVSKIWLLWDAYVFPCIHKSKLQQVVFTMVIPKTQKHVEMNNKEFMLMGAPLQLDSLLKCA